jgi:hypothetical protein
VEESLDDTPRLGDDGISGIVISNTLLLLTNTDGVDSDDKFLTNTLLVFGDFLRY